jgi:hypothetical protein
VVFKGNYRKYRDIEIIQSFVTLVWYSHPASGTKIGRHWEGTKRLRAGGHLRVYPNEEGLERRIVFVTNQVIKGSRAPGSQTDSKVTKTERYFG